MLKDISEKTNTTLKKASTERETEGKVKKIKMGLIDIIKLTEKMPKEVETEQSELVEIQSKTQVELMKCCFYGIGIKQNCNTALQHCVNAIYSKNEAINFLRDVATGHINGTFIDEHLIAKFKLEYGKYLVSKSSIREGMELLEGVAVNSIGITKVQAELTLGNCAVETKH
jgi:hypothetical protein